MGFAQLMHFDDEQIRTEYSALMSTVVWDGSKIVMPINEPAEGLKKSQIQEYIEHYDGPGVQHIALRTDNIVDAVQAMRDRGVRFMTVPDTYYDEAKTRLAEFDLPWDELQRLNILADKDHDGYLLQIFTETITDRPPCSSRSSSATAPRDSARATSRPCSRPSSATRLPRGNL